MTTYSFKLIVSTFLISISLVHCTNHKGSESSEGPLPDSLFRYRLVTIASNDSLRRDFDAVAQEYRLKKLDSTQAETFLGPVLGKYKFFSAYFYSKQSRIGTVTPILIFVDMDDRRSIYLLSLSKDGVVVDFASLTEDRSDTFVDESGAEFLSECDRHSYFLNDSTIQVIEVKHIRAEVESLDSVRVLLRLDGSGYLHVIEKDIIRH